MRPRLFRTLTPLALLAATASVTALPGRAADGTLGPARPRVEVDAEIWRLRPAQTTVALPPVSGRRGPATEIPEGRRNVRLVYPALVEAR